MRSGRIPVPHGPIEVASLARARRIKRRFGAIISIHDPGLRGVLAFHRDPRPALQRLWFVDLDEPDPGHPTATRVDVEVSLAFARSHADAKLLVHCKAGISRSSAIALSIILDRLGRGREADALSALLEVQPDAVPNLIVTHHADEILGCGGRLVAVVQDFDRSRPENLHRRALNAALVKNDTAAIQRLIRRSK